MLSNQVINAYNKSRRATDKSLLCHAPFVNLNFEQNGNITACCYNRREVLGKYPDVSVREAWESPAAKALRQHIQNGELEGGCSVCRDLLRAGNFTGAKARSYDEYARHRFLPQWLQRPFDPGRDLPRVVELELSNTCNLECAMCTGYFSSTIRKNRDQLPPLPMPYDQNFVRQLSAIMPGLTDMKFLGGEPFLIDLYYDIWDEVIRVNPGILVHITTNATIWNNRVRTLLEKLKAGIVISLDSLEPETYAQIRAGAQLDKTLANLEHFRTLTRKKGSFLSIAVCPMISNWQEMPAILEFANRKQAFIHFNVVWSPEALSLRSLPAAELKTVCEKLGSAKPEVPAFDLLRRKNVKAYGDMLATLRSWLEEKQHHPDNRPQVRNQVRASLESEQFPVFSLSGDQRGILAAVLHYEFALPLPADVLPENAQSFQDVPYARWLQNSGLRTDARAFCRNFLQVLVALTEAGYGGLDPLLRKKFDLLTEIIDHSGNIDQLAQDLTETPVMTQLEHIREYTLDELRARMSARYG